MTQAEDWAAEGLSRTSSFYFVIEPRFAGFNSHRIIGVIGLNRFDSIFYMLDTNAWGQGYATEALRAYLPALFKHLPAREYVDASTIDGNIASQRVLEKCGFIREFHDTESIRRTLEEDEEDELRKSVAELLGAGGAPAAERKNLPLKMVHFRCYKQTLG